MWLSGEAYKKACAGVFVPSEHTEVETPTVRKKYIEELCRKNCVI